MIASLPLLDKRAPQTPLNTGKNVNERNGPKSTLAFAEKNNLGPETRPGAGGFDLS
jgi:hypothetical protein